MACESRGFRRARLGLVHRRGGSRRTGYLGISGSRRGGSRGRRLTRKLKRRHHQPVWLSRDSPCRSELRALVRAEAAMRVTTSLDILRHWSAGRSGTPPERSAQERRRASIPACERTFGRRGRSGWYRSVLRAVRGERRDDHQAACADGMGHEGLLRRGPRWLYHLLRGSPFSRLRGASVAPPTSLPLHNLQHAFAARAAPSSRVLRQTLSVSGKRRLALCSRSTALRSTGDAWMGTHSGTRVCRWP